ncbi:MAG: PTS sugar transporter subunit IIA [Rhodospirillaceae bacterium]
MEISDLLEPDAVVSLKASSKKHVLQELSKQAALITEVSDRKIFDTLLERERLGTTGVGKGIAIPHGKITDLGSLHGVFARLEKPVDFESIDDLPVDLIFLLLAPAQSGADHLKALARVSRLLRDTATCEKLRGASNTDGMYVLLTQSEAQAA